MLDAEQFGRKPWGEAQDGAAPRMLHSVFLRTGGVWRHKRPCRVALSMRLILTSNDAHREVRHLAHLNVEEVWMLALHSNKRLIDTIMLFRGTVDHCLVHPRDVFREACRLNASSFVLAHNHPSEDRLPSDADIRLTLRLRRLAELMEMPLNDHLIVTRAGYFSFADHDWSYLEAPERNGSNFSGLRGRT